MFFFVVFFFLSSLLRACGLVLFIFCAKKNLSIFTFQSFSGCFVQITAAFLSSLPLVFFFFFFLFLFFLSTTDYLPPKPAKLPVFLEPAKIFIWAFNFLFFMYLSKKPHFGKGKTLNAVRGKRSSFFFLFPLFLFCPRLGGERFLVGGIRWGNKAGCHFVIFSLVGRCGVPISLLFGRSRSVPGTGERRRMEGGAKARGNRCVTRMGSWPVYYYHHHFIFLYFYIFIYLYIFFGLLLNRALRDIWYPWEKKRNCYVMYGGLGGARVRVLCFSPKKKMFGSFGVC